MGVCLQLLFRGWCLTERFDNGSGRARQCYELAWNLEQRRDDYIIVRVEGDQAGKGQSVNRRIYIWRFVSTATDLLRQAASLGKGLEATTRKSWRGALFRDEQMHWCGPAIRFIGERSIRTLILTLEG